MRIPAALRCALPAVLLLMAGCSGPTTAVAPGPIGPPTVEAARSRWPDATMGSLEEGRQLFLSSCNRCHGYPDITAYAEDRWPKLVEIMGKKAKLSDEQRKLVERFIIATHASSGG